MQVWNEESTSDAHLYYAGDTTLDVGTPGKLIVNHVNSWDCDGQESLAKAFWYPSGNCATNGSIVHVVLRNCAGVTRAWKTGWASSGYSYEGVMVHELGHAAMGFPDVVTNHGAMDGTTSNPHESLHLYPIDVYSSVAQYGVTPFYLGTRVSTNDGWSWSSVSSLTSAPVVPTSFQPGLDTRHNDPTYGVEMTGHASWWNFLDYRKGTHGSWNTSGNQPSGTGIGQVQSWSNVAYSDYGEIMLLWVDNCDNRWGCQIKYAFSSNQGSSWTTGTISNANTFGRPEVAYDAFRDRYVVAFLGSGEAKVWTASTPAVAPAWSSVYLASQSNEVFRYVGGIVFDRVTGAGLLTTAYSGSWSPQNMLTQHSFTYDGAAYDVGWGYWALNSSERVARRTRRHFGMARRSDTGAIVMTWHDQTNDMFCMARKSSVSPSAIFTDTNCGAYAVRSSGIDIAYDEQTARFVAGHSW